jgi:hypothetical protein
MFQTKRMFLVLQKKKKPIPSCQQHLKHKNQIRIIIIIVLIIIIIKTVKKKKMEIRIGVKKDYFVFVVLSLLLFFDFFLSFFVAYFPHFLLSLLSFSLIGSFNSFRHAAFINIIFGFNLLLKDNKQIKKEEE